MSPSPQTEPGIRTVEDLLTHAQALEREAQDRYTELADAMETHNNFEVSALFRRMAELEGMHLDEIVKVSDGFELKNLKPWEYRWTSPENEGPETTPLDAGHYLMHPHFALTLALHNEERAAAYFQAIADNSGDPKLNKMATELAAEERQHVQWVKEWLTKFPEPEAGWDDDPDPVNTPE